MSNKFTYKCIDCGKEFITDEAIYLCDICSKSNTETKPPKGVLKVIYDYEQLQKTIPSFTILKLNNFMDLFPIENLNSFSRLRVGQTPLYKFNNLDNVELPFHLYLKDDGQNPTYSFKDRASNLVSAFAKEKGYQTIVAASTGNAGSSLAGICASQKQKAVIMVPESAPIAKLTQIIMYGATIVPVKGTYDEAFDLSIKATNEFGWYNRNTAYNPLTIEGKKTVSYELFDQLNEELPDRIFVPVGDGVIISGVYKGYEDLLNLGLIHRIPKIVAVQAKGSNNLIQNLNTKEFISTPGETIADSISVDIPRNFHLAKQYLKSCNGEFITVSDEDILNASQILSANTGIFAEPAAAAAFAGMLMYQQIEKIEPGSKNVVLLTGSGLKDLKSVKGLLNIPNAIKPDLENLKNLLK